MDALKPLALSVKILLFNQIDKCLLLKRSMSSKGNPGKWDLPGGKIDIGESFDQALLREIREETGLEAVITGVAGTAYSESPNYRIVYLVLEGRVTAGEAKLSDEHDELAWVHRRDLQQMDLVKQFEALVVEYSQKR